jgi:hypothetical protein
VHVKHGNVQATHPSKPLSQVPDGQSHKGKSLPVVIQVVHYYNPVQFTHGLSHFVHGPAYVPGKKNPSLQVKQLVADSQVLQGAVH